MKWRGTALGTGLLLLLLGSTACGDSLLGGDSRDALISGSGAPPVASPVDLAPNGATESNDPIDEPEIEREDTFRAPVVTGKYVWSANPASGRVAIIDAETYEIRAAEAGLRPTFIAAVGGAGSSQRALVINTGSDDATLLELAESGELRTETIGLHQGADSWSVGPSGRHAIAWTDARKATRPDATDGFQDITVIALPESGKAVSTRLTVGYRPTAFAFDAAGRRAFGITEDGISVIELDASAARLSRLVTLPSTSRTQPDVSVTPDGSRALARLEGSPLLFDIDLASGQTRQIDLGANLTDLDLSADGTRAVAVLQRTTGASPSLQADAGAGNGDAGSDAGADAAAPQPTSELSRAVFLPIPAGLGDASLRQTLSSAETFRSVSLSADGAHAVLFTTARASSRVTLVGPDLNARTAELIAPVRAVFVTADGANAIALQDPPASSVKKGAFSVLSLTNVRAPKLVASDAPAVAVALTAGSSERALVTVSDPATNSFGTYLVRTANLQVDFSSLSSEPLASSTVPGAQKGFVAQVHPEGRITFIDLNDGAGREITGFELSSKVVNQ
jgi:DNA-binding beta-propeller fold protein YncE